MPIKGNVPTRLSRLGKIKIGEKIFTDKGKEIPTSLDYFRATGEFANEFNKAYGDKPKRIKVLFPYPDIEENLNEWYRLYGTSGLKRICDGETAKIVKEGEFVEQPCICDPDKRDCKPTMIISVVVLGVSVIGAWNLTTSSSNSRSNIRAALQFVSSLTNGKYQSIPFYLSVEMKTSSISGVSHKYPVISCTPVADPGSLIPHESQLIEENYSQVELNSDSLRKDEIKAEVIEKVVDSDEREEPPLEGTKNDDSEPFDRAATIRNIVDLIPIMGGEIFEEFKRNQIGDNQFNRLPDDNLIKFLDDMKVRIKK